MVATNNNYVYDYDGFASNYELTNGQTLQILTALELMTQTGKEGLFRIDVPEMVEVSI